jgi:hypothetical protein
MLERVAAIEPLEKVAELHEFGVAASRKDAPASPVTVFSKSSLLAASRAGKASEALPVMAAVVQRLEAGSGNDTVTGEPAIVVSAAGSQDDFSAYLSPVDRIYKATIDRQRNLEEGRPWTGVTTLFMVGSDAVLALTYRHLNQRDAYSATCQGLPLLARELEASA